MCGEGNIVPMNQTSDDAADPAPLGWIMVPLFLSLLFYVAIVLFTWPYARPLVPLALLWLALLVPPLFPFLLFYVLFSLWCIAPVMVVSQPVSFVATPSHTHVIAVVEGSGRGRLRPGEVRTRSVSPRRSSSV